MASGGGVPRDRPRMTSWSSTSSLTSFDSPKTARPSLVKMGRKPSILDEIDTRQRNDVSLRLRGLQKSTSDAPPPVTMQLPVIVKSSCPSPLVTNGIKSPVSGGGGGYRSVLSEISKSQSTSLPRSTRSLPRGATLDYSSLSNYSSPGWRMKSVSESVSESKECDDSFAEHNGHRDDPVKRDFNTIYPNVKTSVNFSKEDKVKLTEHSVENIKRSNTNNADCTDSANGIADAFQASFTDADSPLQASSKNSGKYHSTMFLFPTEDDPVEDTKIREDLVDNATTRRDDPVGYDNLEKAMDRHSISSSVEASSNHPDLSVSIVSSEAASEQDTSEDVFYTAKEFESSDDAYESAIEHELMTPILPVRVYVADETKILSPLHSFLQDKEIVDVSVDINSECASETTPLISDQRLMEDFALNVAATSNGKSNVTNVNQVEEDELLISIAESNQSVPHETAIIQNCNQLSHDTKNCPNILTTENKVASTLVSNLDLLSSLDTSYVILDTAYKNTDVIDSSAKLIDFDSDIKTNDVKLIEHSNEIFSSEISVIQPTVVPTGMRDPESFDIQTDKYSDTIQMDKFETKPTTDIANAFRYADELLDKLSSMSLLSNEPIDYNHPTVSTSDLMTSLPTYSSSTHPGAQTEPGEGLENIAEMCELSKSEVKLIRDKDDENLTEHNVVCETLCAVHSEEESDQLTCNTTDEDNRQLTDEAMLPSDPQSQLYHVASNEDEQIHDNDQFVPFECSNRLKVQEIDKNNFIKSPFKASHEDEFVENVLYALNGEIQLRDEQAEKPLQKKVRFLFDKEGHVNITDCLNAESEADINNTEVNVHTSNIVTNGWGKNNAKHSDMQCEMQNSSIEIQTILDSHENGFVSDQKHAVINTSTNSCELSSRKCVADQNEVDNVIDSVDLSKIEGDEQDEWRTMEVEIEKGVTGLGFCITGGIDSPLGKAPITVKRIFNGNTDAQRILRAGDELLSIGEVVISTSTQQQALQVLKSVPRGPIKLRIRRQV